MQPLETEWLLPSPAELKDLVLRQLGSTSLFAAKFREAAARALLLAAPPSRNARAPLATAQTRRGPAGRGRALFEFPDAAGNVSRMRPRSLRPRGRHRYPAASAARHDPCHRRSIPPSPRPTPPRCSSPTSPTTFTMATPRSPSAAPRRSPSINRSSKRSSAAPISASFWTRRALAEVEQQLQALDPDYQARHTDGLHDLLLRLGDLSLEEIQARTTGGSIEELTAARRAVRVRIARRDPLHPRGIRSSLSRCGRRAAAARPCRRVSRSHATAPCSNCSAAMRARTDHSPPPMPPHASA